MKQKPKFKIGDQVRILDSDIFHPDLEIGDVGVVTKINDKRRGVREDYDSLNIFIDFFKNGNTYPQRATAEDIEQVNSSSNT